MSDVISRQQAINALTKDKKALEHIINGMSGHEKEFDRFVGQRNQVDSDIYAIEQLPPAELGTNLAEVGTDTISRQAAIDAVKRLSLGETDALKLAMRIGDYLERLSPAQPERIKGHWIESDAQNRLMKNLIAKGETWRVCDKCGAGFMIGYQYECDKLYHETFHNFCPKCGAEMEVTT